MLLGTCTVIRPALPTSRPAPNDDASSRVRRVPTPVVKTDDGGREHGRVSDVDPTREANGGITTSCSAWPGPPGSSHWFRDVAHQRTPEGAGARHG
jgi:hypothetical protein